MRTSTRSTAPLRRIARATALASALAVAACGAPPRLPRAPKGAPALELLGAVKGAPIVLGRDDLAALPTRSVRGVAPGGAEALYQGASLADLLERAPLAKGADTAVLRSAKGLAVPVSLQVIRQLKPVLAGTADGKPFTPRVVAWPSAEQRGLVRDPRVQSWWVEDLAAIELVSWDRTYGRALAVPPGAPDAARVGSGIVGARCVACHEVRGAGGKSAPDLTRVADRISQEAFERTVRGHAGWIERPADERPGEALAQVWAYLRAVSAASAGQTSPEEPPEPNDGDRAAR